MTAAPLSMVAIRMSWPGQSTKETCRCSFHVFPSSSNVSGAAEPLALRVRARVDGWMNH